MHMLPKQRPTEVHMESIGCVVKESRLSNFVGGGKGIPGNYSLNQKVSKFGDRRTKRNRDRSTSNRKAINQSKNEE